MRLWLFKYKLNFIQIQDWSKILDLLSALVSQFLMQHGFSLRETETIPSLDNSFSSVSMEPVNYKRDLSISFENVLHIKSGGRRQYTFQVKELRGGASLNDDNLIEHNKDSENNFEINEAYTQDLNSKKLKLQPFNTNRKLKAKVDRSRLRTSIFCKDKEGTNNSRAVSWAKETFEVKFNNFLQFSSPLY